MSKEVLVEQEKMVVEKENEFNKIDQSLYRPIWTAEEKSAFKTIDRKQENKDVVSFQKNGDVRAFERVYEGRVPTLKVWARKYYYLMDSVDDMFGELSCCFAKATMTYKGDKGSFNTWLYTLLQNCVRNIRNGKKAKKRKPIGSDPNSISNFTLSLDYDYNCQDGSESTLKDVLSEDLGEEGNQIDQMSLDETISIISKKDPDVMMFLKDLGKGNTISSLIKQLKTKTGRIKISKDQANRLDTKRRCNRIVSNIIKEHADIHKFELLDYKITRSNKLHYTVELHKTEEADNMMKTIRTIRRDKEKLLSVING